MTKEKFFRMHPETRRELQKKINHFKKLIAFDNLSKEQIKQCYKLLSILSTDRKLKGSELADEMHLSKQDVRNVIMWVRREMSRFTTASSNYYLVSDTEGYWITNNYEEIVKYYHKLNKRLNNTQLQWLENRLILADKLI